MTPSNRPWIALAVLGACHAEPRSPVVVTAQPAPAPVDAPLPEQADDADDDDEADADAPYDPRNAHVIAPEGVGPIRPSMRPTPATMAPLIPELTWKLVHAGDAEGGDVTFVDGDRGNDRAISIMLSQQPPGSIFTVMVFDPHYATAARIKVGDRVAQLVRAYPDLACVLEVSEIWELTCTSATLSHVGFMIETHDLERRNAPIPPEQIAKHKIWRIDW